MSHARKIRRAILLIVILISLQALNSSIKLFQPYPRPPISIELSVTPNKGVCAPEDTIHIFFQISLDFSDSTYVQGRTYVIDTDDNKFRQSGLEVLESSLDTLTYLSDENNSIAGQIKIKYSFYSAMQLGLYIYRLSNDTSKRYNEKFNSHYDQEGIFFMIPKIRFDKTNQEGFFYYLKYPDQ